MSHVATRERPPIDRRKLGMWLFLASEVMFFSGLIATFVYFKVQNPGESAVLDVGVTTVNTFLLLTSSFTVVRGLQALREGNRMGLWNNMIYTFFLGAMFLMGQALEFSKLGWEGITLQRVFGSTFFVTTSFHGFHVFIGLMWVLLIVLKIFFGRIKGAEQAMQVEIFGLYWHFVDVVWIILFTVIYLIR